MTQSRWFAVKSLYRTKVNGRPKGKDQYYKSGIVAIEERIVLIKARNSKFALRKGEREAIKYAKDICTSNKYGQDVVTEFLGYVESYELDDQPSDGMELYSATESAPIAESTRSLNARKFGKPIDPSLSPQFIAGNIYEELESVFGPEWPLARNSRPNA